MLLSWGELQKQRGIKKARLLVEWNPQNRYNIVESKTRWLRKDEIWPGVLWSLFWPEWQLSRSYLP